MWQLGDDLEFTLARAIRVPEAVENFEFVTFKENLYLFAANGPYISLLKVDVEEPGLELITTIHAFQKPVMKLAWDNSRQRLIASGLD